VQHLGEIPWHDTELKSAPKRHLLQKTDFLSGFALPSTRLNESQQPAMIKTTAYLLLDPVIHAVEPEKVPFI